ncbi:MAG: carboxypeptidase-like regulatory domain-containing protein [Dysgonamonadaceae bacterium]|jgi:hypothetical protein|nr:carboxypeptidase-like regulatory domain-containing protein [Dysgonamonadaceae bacterium]
MNIVVKLLIIIGVLIPTIANAQENEYISGSVYDKVTGETLISASVYFDNLADGTITNADGEFILRRIPDVDSLVFSYLGYAPQKYSLTFIPSKIYLEPIATNLPEIVVSADYANKIVEQIWEKYNKISKEEIKQKKGKYSFFYRQITQSHGVYNEFIECFLTADNTHCIDNLSLQEGRYAKIRKDSTVYFTFDNFYFMSQIKPFRQKDAGKKTVNTFIQPNFKKLYYVDIEDRFSDEKGSILVLNFHPRKQNVKDIAINAGKLYVRESDFSIIRFEGTSQMNIKFQVIYKERPNTYPIVETVTCSLDSEKQYKKENQEIIKYKVKITSVLFMVDQQFDDSGKKLNKKPLLEILNKKTYNPEFWKNNPIVKRTKIDENVIKEFEAANAFDVLN